MEAYLAIGYFILIFIIVFLVARMFFKIHSFSSIAIATLFSIVITGILCPVSSIDKSMQFSNELPFYAFLMTLGILFLIFYILWKVVIDVDPNWTSPTLSNFRKNLVDREESYHGS